MGGQVGRWTAKLGRWVEKLEARLLTTAGLWVRIQTSLKNTNGLGSGQHTLARQKIYKKNGDADPGFGIRFLFGPWIRDPGWVESQHLDPGSGMNSPDHIF
jgi:hypothetical protein